MAYAKKGRRNTGYKKKIQEALSNGPLGEKELVKKLKIPHASYNQFLQEIKKLSREKILSFRNQKYHLEQRGKKVVGTISVHPRGFGFVIPKNRQEFAKDVFIPKKFMKGAIDGDLVEIEVNMAPSKKGFEGKVIQIVKRGKKTLVGTVLQKQGEGYLLFCSALKEEKRVLLQEKTEELQIGDRVSVKVTNWGEDKGVILTSLEKKIGSIFDPKTDISSALEEFQIEKNFPKEAEEEAQSKGSSVSKEDAKNRIDYTHLETITIDPKTAKDFDDAISLEKEGSTIHLYVHIADVAHYVKAGTTLDKIALQRANSTYFPGRCVPMLPEALSNGLCSLKPEVIRLAVTVKMSFSKEGELIDTKIDRSSILSKKRFSYEEAFSVLQKKQESPYLPLLEDLVFLCSLLKKKRTERGSIDFALSEASVVVDDKEDPTHIEVHEYDITHQMVEEFMLKANEVIASTLFERGLSLIFRIHESPSLETLEDFYQTVHLLGFSLPDNPSIQDLQKLFLEAKGSPFFHRLSVAFIRSMKLALYSVENIGHYGLALTYYTHFTSPIRRYSDLIISRLLFDEPFDTDLIQIASHCSEKERNSMKAEQTVISMKKLRLLEKAYKGSPEKLYVATITRVKPSHLFFELEEFFFEGKFSFSDIDLDYFNFLEEKAAWIGRDRGVTLAQGDKILVSLKDVDLLKQEASFLFSKKI